jgi:hypothetical protein
MRNFMHSAHDFRGQKGLPSSFPHFSLKATLSVTAGRRAAHGFTGLLGTHFSHRRARESAGCHGDESFFAPALFIKVVNVLGYDCQLGLLWKAKIGSVTVDGPCKMTSTQLESPYSGERHWGWVDLAKPASIASTQPIVGP